MRIAISEADPRPIYQQIVDEVRRGIVVGAIEAGEPLPSVRQLAAELRLNPNTVQQAYRELEREGLVQAQRGRGTFVVELGNEGTARERRMVAASVAEAAEGTARERRMVAASVAEAALRAAQRSGLEVEELVEAIRRAAGDARTATTTEGAAP